MDNKEYIDEIINTYLSYDESENDIRGYDAIRDTLDSITSDLQDRFDSYSDEVLCELYAKCFTTLSSINAKEITDLNTKVQAIVFERICELTMIEVGKRKALKYGFYYDPEHNMVTRRIKRKSVLLTAKHVNFGLINFDYDWKETKYILFEDGTLQSIIFKGEFLYMTEKTISKEQIDFIKNNIKPFINNTPEIEAFDGDAWEFEGSDFHFRLGYIYDTPLEQIAKILM